LSNKVAKLEYDMKMNNRPEMIYNSEKMKKMNEATAERDKTGHVIKPMPMKGSYAEYRLEKLKELRKQFNVDDHGFYKGGVPAAFKGTIRTNSGGIVGEFHSPYEHNETHDRPHIRPHVAQEDALHHKNFLNCNYKIFNILS
jgi:hypothetical protein